MTAVSRGWWAVALDDGRSVSLRARDLRPLPPEADPEEEAPTMSDTLRKASQTYEKVTTNGRTSRICGDDVSHALQGLSDREAVGVAARTLGLSEVDLLARYARLNNGQRKMAASNLLRNAVKRGDVALDELAVRV